MTPLLLLALAPAAPIPAGAQKPGDAKLDGVWELKSREYRGQEMATSDTLKPSYTLIVSGDNYVFRTHTGTIKLDPAKKSIDLAITGGLYANSAMGGMFERTGDTLKVALPSTPRTATARPAELKTTADTAYYVYTFSLNKDVNAEKTAEMLKERATGMVNRGGFVAPGGGFVAPGGGFVAPGGGFAPARIPTAQQLQEALERIEKLEKRIEELEKQNRKP